MPRFIPPPGPGRPKGSKSSARQPVHGRADKHSGARGRDITRGKLQPLRLALRASPAAHRAEVPPAPRPATSN